MSKMDILICGKTRDMFFAGDGDDNYLVTVGLEPVPDDHPVRLSQKIGQKVVEEIQKQGKEFDYISSMRSSDVLAVHMKPVEPPEKVGLEWLKSLPVGTRILSNQSKSRVIIVPCGLYLVDSSWLWTWPDSIADLAVQGMWIENASAKTCPEWLP